MFNIDHATEAKNDAPPTVSIIIPFRNREKTLSKTLESIYADYSYDKEKIALVFFDDHSTDSSSRILKEFIVQHGPLYSQVIQRRKDDASEESIARARNECLSLAKETAVNYVISIDSDVEIPRGTIADLVGLLRKDNKIGMASIPYAYVEAGKKYASEVDINMGCTIMSREFLDQVNWTINDRFTNVDDLWLGAKAEKLGFKVVRLDNKRANHLKEFVYGDHLKNRFLLLPRYHYLLIREGLITRRLKRTYIYYSAYLALSAICLLNSFALILFIPLFGLGLWHYRSISKFLLALPVGITMTIGLIANILKGFVAD